MKFDRNSRLITRKDFESVFKAAKETQTGRILRKPYFMVYVRYTETPARLGISLSKKVIRTASKRNRLKRCLREFFRLNRERFPGDLIVRWLKSPKDTSYENLVSPLVAVTKLKN